MPKLLVVDDEEVYRRQLEFALAPEGYEVATAASGREAIDLGARYRPDVLVVDWMLKNHVHGLHVARALRVVAPAMRAILVTGFASDDLRAEAAKARVADFIQKPFGLERIQRAVREAMTSVPGPPEEYLPAVVEVDSSGAILFANRGAREMLAETPAGASAACLRDVFLPDEVPDLDQAGEGWVVVAPRTAQPTHWWVRSQALRPDRHRLVVLRRQHDPHYLDLPIVEMLLGFKDRDYAHWPVAGRVLVVDTEALNRGFSVSVLESVGAGCYAAESLDQALRLLETDQGIQFVLLDYGMSGSDPSACVGRIRTSRPGVVIVGTGDDDRRDDFACLGVDRFVRRPWRVSDLINAVTGRIGNCVECGLPLPLKRPGPGDAATSWVCAGCGARYRAVLDRGFPPDVLRNVRPPDDA